MKKIIACFFLLLGTLIFPSIALAKSEINIYQGTSPYVPPLQAWVDSPYAQDVPTPDTRVDVFLSGCPVNKDAACAVPARFWNKPFPTIWLVRKYLEPDSDSQEMTRKIFFHELGHVFDYTHLDDTQRDEIISMLGYSPEIGWYGNSKAQPNELFAEGAAACWFGPDSPFDAYGYSFNYQEIQPLCQAMAGSYANDNSWFGQRIVRAKSRAMVVRNKIVKRGPKIRWGGGNVWVSYRSISKLFDDCKISARFGIKSTIKTVNLDLCGNNLKSQSTLPGPFKINFRDIPSS